MTAPQSSPSTIRLTGTRSAATTTSRRTQTGRSRCTFRQQIRAKTRNPIGSQLRRGRSTFCCATTRRCRKLSRPSAIPRASLCRPLCPSNSGLQRGVRTAAPRKSRMVSFANELRRKQMPTKAGVSYPEVDCDLGEQLHPEEIALAGQIAEAIEKSIRAQYQAGHARRDAHPKAHAIVRAEFRVNASIANNMAKGIF